MDVVYASSSASVSHLGAQVPVHKGQHWAAEDPLVQQYPHLFSHDPRYGLCYTREPAGYDAPPMDSPVETATAAPGERRSTRRSSAV